MTPDEIRTRKVAATYRLFRTLAITHGLRCRVFIVESKQAALPMFEAST